MGYGQVPYLIFFCRYIFLANTGIMDMIMKYFGGLN